MGTKVAVFGTTNSDGSVTAQTVQINPAMGMAGMMLGGKPKNTGTKSADAKEIIVTGQNFSFSPNSITVPVGQKTRISFQNDWLKIVSLLQSTFTKKNVWFVTLN
jgi:plastocyanin